MRVIINGGSVTIHGDEELVVADKVPVGCYDVCFSKFTGPFLKKREDLKVTEKIYGNHPAKADKAFKAFNATERSLGIILSGKKGIGKTLFVNVLAEKALAEGLPVLIVSGDQPGLPQFLGSITQDCVVIFDEFEKNFRDENDDEDDNYDSAQTGLLSMFDGLDGSRKLFLVTCNNIRNLNPFMINRPGRFHYHFKLQNPSADEVRAYATDHIKPEYAEVIERVVNLSYVTELTYDWLRAICFELNCGYDLEEVVEDLNIEASSSMTYDFEVMFNGTKYSGVKTFQVGKDETNAIWLESFGKKNKNIKLYFNQNSIKFGPDGAYIEVDHPSVELNDEDGEPIDGKLEYIHLETFAYAKSQLLV